jgi:thiol-disulfide isomerase/thioredoxin
VTLADFHGRYILVNLWATWCAPCVEELPALGKLQAAIPRDKLEILAVNAGRSSLPEAAQFLKEHGAANLSLHGDSDLALMRALKAYGLPATVLIDPNGKEIARAMGQAQWSAPDAIAWFRTRTAQ